MYHVFTKPGCSFCTDAERLLGERGIEYVAVKCTDAEDARSKLGVMAPPFTTFPVIIDAQGRYVGGYIQLRDTLTEPLLQPSLTRFSAFPIEYEHIYELYKRAISCFWTADEITLAQDATDFQTLTADEQHFVKYVLAFFASSDGIVNENLMGNFSKEIQISEARSFYAFQAFNEAEHNRTYGMLIDSLVTDLDERDRLFNAITEIPAVQRKAEWALTWLDPATRSFAERLVAFLCVEGILFSGSFCAIFWLKRAHPGLLPGLSPSNQFIARDEASHCEHAPAPYNCPGAQADARAGARHRGGGRGKRETVYHGRRAVHAHRHEPGAHGPVHRIRRGFPDGRHRLPALVRDQEPGCVDGGDQPGGQDEFLRVQGVGVRARRDQQGGRGERRPVVLHGR